ncbi:hypothetical protein Tco_1046008 [Tanacetum coccineum]
MQSTMELIYTLWFLFMAYISYSDAKLDSRVKRVFHTYDFQGESGLLQFWECSTHEGTNNIGCSLTLTDQFCMSNIHDNRLLDYRMRCFDNSDRFIGQQTNVGIWFAGRAAQTGLADHRIRHVVLNQDHQYIDETSEAELNIHIYGEDRKSGMQSSYCQVSTSLFGQTPGFAEASDYELDSVIAPQPKQKEQNENFRKFGKEGTVSKGKVEMVASGLAK